MQATQQLNSSQQRGYVQKLLQLSLRYLVCVVIAFFVLIPVVVAILGGFKSNGELTSLPFSLPTTWRLENYAGILTTAGFWQAIENSIITTLATVGLLLLVACPASFILARVIFPGRKIAVSVALLGLLFPIYMAILPLYITLRNLSLLNTLPGVILPQVAYALPITILILHNFFQAIPQELEDATYIDGGSQIDFFWYILLPLARPALAVVSLLAMVNSWNSFLLPLLALNSSNLWTLPLGVMQFQGQYATNWAAVMAFVSLTIFPAIVFYLFAERHLIAGLTAGAVKG
jgi:raffinose/stachyose/melibiose transport system permease protein